MNPPCPAQRCRPYLLVMLTSLLDRCEGLDVLGVSAGEFSAVCVSLDAANAANAARHLPAKQRENHLHHSTRLASLLLAPPRHCPARAYRTT